MIEENQNKVQFVYGCKEKPRSSSGGWGGINGGALCEVLSAGVRGNGGTVRRTWAGYFQRRRSVRNLWTNEACCGETEKAVFPVSADSPDN